MAFVNEKLLEFNNYLKGKKVAVIGLGVSNLPLIDYLYNVDAKVTVFDNKDIESIDKELIKKITDYKMEISFGKDNLKMLVGFDLIFRSPSCLPNFPELVAEKERGAIVTTEIEMVLKLAPCKKIGVTGSDGKTTTTTLISEILKQKGYNVFLGGNIGIPLFTKISEMEPDDIVVLELSSFQLMNMMVSPDISIITNITPNHLDKHTDMDEYINAKKNIFTHQSDNGVLIIYYDNDITRSFESEANGKVILYSSKNKLDTGYVVDNGFIKSCNKGVENIILDTKNMRLRGVHNFENATAAIIATKDLVELETACEAIVNFNGVEHRLELIKESKNDVKWYNDSVSSSPTRTIAGLNAFSEENIVLIAGGYDKNLDYTPIAKPIVNNCKALVLLGATSDKIENAVKVELIKQEKEMPIVRCRDLEQTIMEAQKLALKGDMVLFSPASASFDMFKNFAERGKLFKKYVNELVD